MIGCTGIQRVWPALPGAERPRAYEAAAQPDQRSTASAESVSGSSVGTGFIMDALLSGLE